MNPVITSGMRQWRSDRIVRAERIVLIEPGAHAVTLHFAPLADGTPHTAFVTHQWNVKHHPLRGGYLVAFDDGFHTFMTAATFESHYAPLPAPSARRKVRVDDGMATIRCPGCNTTHSFYVEHCDDLPDGPLWHYNGNPVVPTFTPSIYIARDVADPPVTDENRDIWNAQPWPQRQLRKTCHSFVTDGQIQFLPDSTHALAGKTVELPYLENT